MGNRHHQLDVSAALAANLLLCHFHSTAVADDTLIADALVLSAMALIVLGGTENALAEETVALGLVGTVVDGLWFQDLTIRVLQNLFGRSQANGYLGKVCFYLSFFLKSHIISFV